MSAIDIEKSFSFYNTAEITSHVQFLKHMQAYHTENTIAYMLYFWSCQPDLFNSFSTMAPCNRDIDRHWAIVYNYVAYAYASCSNINSKHIWHTRCSRDERLPTISCWYRSRLWEHSASQVLC